MRKSPRGSETRHREIGFLEVGQDRHRALVIGAAVFGGHGASGRPVEELNPELLLEIDHVLAHRRAREPERARDL
jgi:hypothetical protein